MLFPSLFRSRDRTKESLAMKRLALVLVIAVLAALYPSAAFALPSGTRVQKYKGGLNFPVDMGWVPGSKRIFVTEKAGRIRIINKGRLRARACRRINVSSSGERGLLGIELHPNFKRNRYLYAFYVNASPLESRVTRYKVKKGRCRSARNVVKNIPVSSGYHIGGQIEFAGGKLFVSVGDGHSAGNAQNKDNRLGKILRYNSDGSIPKGNPFSSRADRSPVWSYGHRNGFGLTHKPGTGRLYETENGPQCDDELNRIRKGRNYGWGSSYACGTAGVGPNPKRPLKRWSNVIAVTDPWFYKGRMGRLSGDIYAGGFSDGKLHRLVLNRKGTRVKNDRAILGGAGPIVDVSKGPKGWLYYMTPSGIFRIVQRR